MVCLNTTFSFELAVAVFFGLGYFSPQNKHTKKDVGFVMPLSIHLYGRHDVSEFERIHQMVRTDMMVAML